MKTSSPPDDIVAARFLSGAASLDDAIDQAFSELPRKVRTIVRRWAVQDEPNKHGVPIRQKTLAKKCRIGERSIRRYLATARRENPSFFRLLEHYRQDRFRETRGGEVR